MQTTIKNIIEESIQTKKDSLYLTDKIEEAANIIIGAYKNNKKVLIAGNGGSAADAQHFAGELVGRFKKERKPLDCIALTTDTSILTAVGNDYGFEHVFARQVEARGKAGDVYISISTSGNSQNIIYAIEKAKEMKIRTVYLGGKDGGKIKGMSDVDIIVPSDNTPRIQEMHITILHILAELIEQELFKWLTSKNE